MSNLYDLGRIELEALHKKLNEGQIGMFNRMYGSIKDIPNEKIDWAIQQCNRSIVKNIK